MSPKLFVLLENIRSAYNVGSIFRTCDAAGVDKLFLAGFTAYPPDSKLNKTALGSIKNAAWEYNKNPLKIVQDLKLKNIQLLTLESEKQSPSIYKINFFTDTCLIFGNEIQGVSKQLKKLSNSIVKIPQFGKKESLNVSVAAGIAIYEFIRKRLEGNSNL